MTVEEEKEKCLTEGIIAPIPCPPGYQPPPLMAPFRILSEGQYQAMLEVWLGAGKKVAR